MPYVRKNTDPMRRVLNAYELNTGRALAGVLGVSPVTALSRIKTPDDLTLGELRRMVSRGHVPIEEVRAAI